MRCIDENYLARVGVISMALGIVATPVLSFIISIVAAYVSTATLFAIAGCLDVLVCIYIFRSKTFDEDTVPATGEECA